MTARYLVGPSLWNTVISVAVASVGGLLVGTATPLGGFGTGNGGNGFFNSATDYGTGGGGGSSVKLGVRDQLASHHHWHQPRIARHGLFRSLTSL